MSYLPTGTIIYHHLMALANVKYNKIKKLRKVKYIDRSASLPSGLINAAETSKSF